MNAKTKINVPLKCISANSSNPTGHEEVPGPTNQDTSLVFTIIGSAPAKFKVPLRSVQLNTNENPSQALKVFFMS